MAFRVETRTRGGKTVYSLHNDATGASASILPSYGFNLFDLRLPLAGQVRPVLVAADVRTLRRAAAKRLGSDLRLAGKRILA